MGCRWELISKNVDLISANEFMRHSTGNRIWKRKHSHFQLSKLLLTFISEFPLFCHFSLSVSFMFYYYFMLSSITLIYALNNDHLGSSSHSELSSVPPPPPTLFFWGGKVLFGLIFIFTLLSVKTKFLENFFRLIGVVSTHFYCHQTKTEHDFIVVHQRAFFPSLVLYLDAL